MKVKVTGFEWFIPKFTTSAAFCEYLTALSGKLYEEHVFAVARKDDYWVGVILTDKLAKAYCQKQKNGDKFTVTARQLDEGTNIVDFNFFIFREDTGRGLYQYYHNSCRPNSFHHFFAQRFEVFKAEQSRQAQSGSAIAEYAPNTGLATKKNASLRYTTIVKLESIGNLIDQMSRIKSFDFECTTLHAVEEDFRPVADYAKRVSHHVSFHKNKFADEVKGVVRTIVSKTNYFKKGKIIGVDPSGREVAYSLMENPESISEADYDNRIMTVNIDSTHLVESVQNSKIIANLLALADEPRVKALLRIHART